MRSREAYLRGKHAALSLAGAGGNDADRLARALLELDGDSSKGVRGRGSKLRSTGDPIPWGPRTSPEGVSGHVPLQLGNADGQYGGVY